ncbi:MAG: GPR endopeptidase [Clostridia bacterium]|nr:GPR endopeptidase [Clostridia bacterium]
MNYKRTDLALEAHEMLLEAANELSGVTMTEEENDEVKISRIEIKTKEAENAMGKPVGNYITIEIPDVSLTLSESNEKISKAISKELSSLLNLSENSTILVVGLGNRFITPDALGPSVISKLMVTRHLFQYIPEEIDEGLRPVCAVAPGVLGLTGIETVEIIKGITDKIKPDAIIAIDALAARNVKRIVSTIQLADTGISPGAGVGNNRKGLNQEYLSVPVIAIGMPTVIDAATITSDTIDSLKKNMESPLGVIGSISHMDEDERYATIKKSLSDELLSFIVTPKNIDSLIDKASTIVAGGINLALHNNITLEDAEAFLS